MEYSGIRHHLLRLGVDLPGDTGRRARSAAISVAAIRFLVSGVVLYGWMRLKGTPSPTQRQWAGATLLGALIFLLDYGCLAEIAALGGGSAHLDV